MKLIKTFFKSIKLQKVMKHLQLLLLIADNLTSRCVESTSNTECAERLIRVQTAIDLETDKLLDETLPTVTPEDVEPEKILKKSEKNEDLILHNEKKQGPAPPPLKVVTKVEEPAAEAVAPAEGDSDSPSEEEETEEVLLVYPCSIKSPKGKVKALRLEGIQVSFTAFKTQALKEANDNIYPTVEEVEEALTIAWDMASTGKANKLINDYLIKEIGEYYSTVFKNEGDWYKVSNTLYKAVGIIKNAFGFGTKSNHILVARPWKIEEGEEELVLTRENAVLDVGDGTSKEKPVIKADPVEEKSATADKDGLETVQDVKDEEQQEEEILAAKEAEETELEETAPEAEAEEELSGDEETVDEVDFSTPPPVNSFESFNDIETSVFEILKNADLNIKSAKTEEEKKKFRTDSRDQVKFLVSGWYEALSPEAVWAKQHENGGWNPSFVAYINAIVTECAKHYQD